jgi:hypothetical protein
MYKIQTKQSVNKIVKDLKIEETLESLEASLGYSTNSIDKISLSQILTQAKTNFDKYKRTDEEEFILNQYNISEIFTTKWVDIFTLLVTSSMSINSFIAGKNYYNLFISFKNLLSLRDFLEKSIYEPSDKNTLRITINQNFDKPLSVSSSIESIVNIYNAIKPLMGVEDVEDVKIFSIESGSPINVFFTGNKETFDAIGQFLDELYHLILNGKYREYKTANKNIGEVLDIIKKIENSSLAPEDKTRSKQQITKELDNILNNFIAPSDLNSQIEKVNKFGIIEQEIQLHLTSAENKEETIN